MNRIQSSPARGDAGQTLDDVSPRYLAGAGDPRHVTDYLIATGWSNRSVPGYPHVLLESPDRQLHLALEPLPDTLRDSWWRISSADRTWTARFGAHAPAEIIAGFTDSLLHAPVPAENPWRLAADRGWTPHTAGPGDAVLSPDATAVLARLRTAGGLSGTPACWKTEVSLPGPNSTRTWIWGAAIDETAPGHALAGFVRALTDPAPLLRSPSQLTGLVFGFATATRSAVSPDQHRRRHHQRLEEARRTAPPVAPQTAGPAPGPKHRRRHR
ncbi:DUF317 domain-containing protein [Actinacidiphila sp. bgisy144]|uniref:DUF317 domain-containing protein n=1 Tax=Actinacidiphila sp. bgisy144 TaxID=3413791 RepID=UPI003EB7FAEF